MKDRFLAHILPTINIHGLIDRPLKFRTNAGPKFELFEMFIL